MEDVHKPKSYDKVPAILVESDKNIPGCLRTLNYRKIYKRNAQLERLFMLQQQGAAAGNPGGGAHATIPTPVADEAKSSTSTSPPIQDIGVTATVPTAYPPSLHHHCDTLAPPAIRPTRELGVAAVIQQPRDNGHSGPTEPGVIDYLRAPHHKKTAGGSLTARASPTGTSYAADTAVTVPTSHQAAQTLDRRSLGCVQKPVITVPHPSTNGRPASVIAATSRARPSVTRAHHHFGNHLYKDAHVRRRRRLAEPENSHALLGVDERTYRSEMRQYAVSGGVPAFVPPSAADSTIDRPGRGPYRAGHPVSTEQEYTRRLSSSKYQHFASTPSSHDHQVQMVSAPACTQGGVSYDMAQLGGHSVGSSAPTFVETDVSYDLSGHADSCYGGEHVDEGTIALMIQNILQEVKNALGDGDADIFASQYQPSYLQHPLSVPQGYPQSELVSPLSPPAANILGETGTPQFPFSTPSTVISCDDCQDAYDCHQHGPLHALGSSPHHVLPSPAAQADNQMAYPMSQQAHTSHRSYSADSQSGNTQSGVAMEYLDVFQLSHACTVMPPSFESDYGGDFIFARNLVSSV